MTAEERETLKAEILAELEAKNVKNTPHPLQPTRVKWFKDNGKMTKMFKSYDINKVWDNVRLLTAHIMGENYIACIKDVDKANEICEALCQFVYDKRNEYLGVKKTE